MADKPLITDEEIANAIYEEDPGVGFLTNLSRRIESLVRKRLAERLRDYRHDLELQLGDCCDRSVDVAIEQCFEIVEGSDD